MKYCFGFAVIELLHYHYHFTAMRTVSGTTRVSR